MKANGLAQAGWMMQSAITVAGQRRTDYQLNAKDRSPGFVPSACPWPGKAVIVLIWNDEDKARKKHPPLKD